MRKMKNIRRRFIGMMLAASMMASLAGCGDKNNQNVTTGEAVEGSMTYECKSVSLTDEVKAENVDGKEADDEFKSAAADFSINLFRESVSEDSKAGENVLVSPASVMSALGMTANGAGGDTLADMEQVLTGGIGIDDFNKYMYSYNNRMESAENVSFKNANSIWIRDDGERIQVKDAFLQTDKNYYDADAYMAAFDDSTVKDINLWADENTDGMINEIISAIPEEAVICLINAIAFEGEWETPYEDYQVEENGVFTNYEGIEETAAMLNGEENIYIQDDKATGFIKPYKGGEYGFMAILPNEGITVEEYISGMSGDDFLALYENLSYEKVKVMMPEFSYDYDIEMKDALSEMGMESIFQENADFSNMAETDTGYLYVGKVLHKTYIQVDRYGTKAAATTTVIGVDSCALLEEPKAVALDRPFIYSIIDMETGLPVFIGVTNSVVKN